ncbi:MAG: tetratricopeptide repeat protein [Bacteroidota bacterium]
MSNQKLLLGFFSVLFSSLIFAQPTHIVIDKEKKFKQAQDFFINDQISLAYPLFKELKSEYPEVTQSNHTYLNDDISFYYIICELSLLQPIGADDAINYIDEINNEPRKRQMCFYLGHYFYLQQDFPKAIEYYEQTRYVNLTNDQIGDAKFEMAYSLFNEKKFQKALPLFNEIHQIKTSKYFIPANYYYGFISYYHNDYPEALSAFRTVETHPDYNAVVPYYVAEILYAQGKKLEALKYGDSVINAGGGSFYKKNLELLTGQLYFEKQDYKKALTCFEAFVNNNQKVSKEIMYELSYCYYKNNNSSKAIEGFKQLSNEKDSMGQNSMYLLGELYLKIKDKANARTAFQYSAYNSSNPTQQKVSRFNYAKLSYELDYQDIALNELKKFLIDYPNSEFDSEAKEMMISLLANTNNFNDGLELYKTLNQASPEAQRVYARLLYGKSVQLINDQQPAEADELLSKILTNSNAGIITAYANFWKGEIAYRQQRYDEAIRYLTLYTDSKAPWQGEANVKNAYYTIGYSWFQKEQYKNALTFFEKIATGIKSGATAMEQDAYTRAADCYYMQRDFTKASEWYNNIVSNNFPQADYALYQKAMIAGVKSGTEKIKLMNALVKTYPQSPLVLESQMEIGLTYISDEKFPEAVPFLNTIINSSEAAGLKPKAYLKLGLAYYNNNDNKNALSAYKQLIKLYPQSEESAEAMAIIKDIFIEDGKPDEYISLMKENGIIINVNEADSLSYISAYMKYEAGDCATAISGFGNYISGHANGAYLIEANYYKALCHQKQKEFNLAITGFEYVNSRGVSRFFENATLQLARIYYFEVKDYNNAKKYFESLNGNATNPENQLEALRGLVRSYYQLKDYATANDASKALLSKKGISTDDKSIAGLVLGKSQQAANDTLAAIESFKTVVPINKSAWGAEARYELAATYFGLNNYNVAEKYAMSVIKETGSYDLWVTKSYLLLGDIFMKQKDYFNAKATYESIAKNASITELQLEAQQKLAFVLEEEKKSSRIGN